MLWLTSISPFSIWCVRKKRFHSDLVYLEPNFSYLLIQIYFTFKSHWFGDSHEMGSVSLKIGDGTARFIRFCYVLICHNKYNQSLCPWFFLFLKGKEIVLGSFQPYLIVKTQCLIVYSWHNKHRPETVVVLYTFQFTNLFLHLSISVRVFSGWNWCIIVDYGHSHNDAAIIYELAGTSVNAMRHKVINGFKRFQKGRLVSMQYHFA